MAKSEFDLVASLERATQRGRWGYHDAEGNTRNIQHWRYSELKSKYDAGLSLSVIAEMAEITIEEVEEIFAYGERNVRRSIDEVRERLLAWDQRNEILPEPNDRRRQAASPVEETDF